MYNEIHHNLCWKLSLCIAVYAFPCNINRVVQIVYLTYIL
jgi:hypothetical protein